MPLLAALLRHSKSKHSKTADQVAAVRARHMLQCQPPIFEDQYAMAMTSSLWRMFIKYRLLDKIFTKALFGPLFPIQAAIIIRARFNEDCLQQAIKNGVTQYVILGAGLDTYALRYPELASKLTVFELDLPATQEHKRQRLLEINHSLPSNLKFLSASITDYEAVPRLLDETGFDMSQPAFFSVLGMTYYFTAETVSDIVGSIANVSASGSEMVLDYRLPIEQVPDTHSVEWLDWWTDLIGEPKLSAFTAGDIAELITQHQYQMVEDLPPTEQHSRYIKPMPYELDLSAAYGMAHVRKTS